MKVLCEKCLSCGSCMAMCPMGAISFDTNHKAQIDMSKCIQCQTCVTVCPAGAISSQD